MKTPQNIKCTFRSIMGNVAIGLDLVHKLSVDWRIPVNYKS